MIITNNLLAQNTQRNYNINTAKKTKATNRLSSGYRINKAADDAAGLTISEHMREQIRGLNKGVQNGQDGISFIQVGDGALQEVQNMIHRMKELTIQSLNDTNTEEDKKALQMEFDAIQSEIDRVTKTTQFNTKNVFSEHLPDFYQLEGNVQWNQGSTHVVYVPENELNIEYVMKEGEPAKTVKLVIPEGVYTTQELIDEIDMKIEENNADKDGLNMEYTNNGTCNVNLEGGNKIESVSGGLSYLLYDMYNGGSVGALIGTTVFVNDVAKLGIVAGKNDEMKFQTTDFSGNTSTVSINIPQGNYSRPEIINYLNSQLTGTGVEAVKFSTGIKLQSNTAIISGFKGNMFKIDGGSPIYNSVFYDNIRYGTVTKTSAAFTGGAVIHNDPRDEKFNHFNIDSSNDTLKMTANGGSEVTLNIPAGSYTISQMVDKLNELFVNNGVKATASFYSQSGFLGLKITSDEKGLDSSIEFDKTTGAYKTLFTNCDYTSFSNNATIYADSVSNKKATYTAGKDFSSGAGTLPLTITAGVNDKLNLTLTDGNGTSSSFQLTLDAGSYNNLSDIVSQLDKQLNGTGAAAGYKDMLEVSSSGTKLKITGKDGIDLKKIVFGQVSGNTGYDDLFVGKKVTSTTQTVSGVGSITTNTGITDSVNIDSTNNTFKVKINGAEKTVTLSTGTKSRDEIKAEIDQKLVGTTTESNNTFSSFSVKGSSTQNSINKTGTGSTTVASVSYDESGTSKLEEGKVGAFEYNYPAKVVMNQTIPENITLDSSNNSMVLSINGVNQMLTLNTGTYNRTQLVAELQKQIDDNFGKEYGGATVSLNSSNKLEFTARLNTGSYENDGASTNIAFDSAGSSFIRELCTTRRAASITTPGIPASINVDGSHNVFSFKYNAGSGDTVANLTLAEGTYTRDSLIAEINNQLNNQSIPVKASLNGNGITLTTLGQGNGYMVSYARNSQTGGGSIGEVLFGDYNIEKPASYVTDRDIQNSIEIDDSSNKFKITVDGVDKTVTLDNGTYDRNGFVSMLSSKLSGQGVTVSLSGNRLKYETASKGNGASLSMSYAGGGSSMSKIYGKTVVTTPGATAGFDGSGKLTLTTDNPGHTISMNSDSGGLFQTSTKVTSDVLPTSTEGYLSKKNSYIDGVNITEPVTLDKWNNKMSFNYTHNGVTTPVNVSLEEKSYTFAELQSELQSKLDVAAGTGQFNVTVNGSGVKIECANAGNINRLGNFSGGFYNKVMCNSKEYNITKAISYKAGGQMVDDAYAIGRRDIRNENIEIEKDLNDVFTFDLKAGNNNYTFNMKIAEGNYSGDQFCAELQNKLNEQLKLAGLNENLVKCNIGGVNSGVAGSNDANALCLIMAKDVSAPDVGEYIIDGVRGSAAFASFYQSDGKMEPAFAKGSKDVTEGVEITSENNVLNFEADGVGYSITLDENVYSGDELIEELNKKLQNNSAPVKAKMDGKVVKLEYNGYGKHKIDKVSGSARDSIFYQERQGKELIKTMNIQLSSMAGISTGGNATGGNTAGGNGTGSGGFEGRDYISIKLTELDTAFLDINSIVITKNKYAERALGKLDKALDKVSAIRSQFGADQNRLEHAINNCRNISENTQAAESKIRDADMAQEAVELAKYSILQQSGQAMMAQANSMNEGVLRLLQG